MKPMLPTKMTIPGFLKREGKKVRFFCLDCINPDGETNISTSVFTPLNCDKCGRLVTQITSYRQNIGLNEFQYLATRSADYNKSINYAVEGLVGEAGEVANQCKKIHRDDDNIITEERRKKMLDELGDVLWYAACVAWELDSDLASVAAGNIKKLAKRMENNTIHGDARSES